MENNIVEVQDSILLSIKKNIGIAPDYNAFDVDIITDINSVFMILNQLGIGTKETFSISDKTATWKDFLGEAKNLEAVKSYMSIKVRLMFDTITSTAQIESLNRMASELEWRLNVEAEQSADKNQNGGGDTNDI